MDNSINKVSALFANEIQSTSLTLMSVGDGTYDVTGFYRKQVDSGYPSREVTNREGKVFRNDVETLVNTMLSFCDNGWYHHYYANRSYFARSDIWWKLRIEYEDGRVRRWEGINDAPKNIDSVFDALIAFGMPPIRLSYDSGSFGDACIAWHKEGDFNHIDNYVRVLSESCVDAHNEPDDEAKLVVDEFCEDVVSYITSQMPEALHAHTLRTWCIDTDIKSICKQDVRGAPREKMLALYGVLATHKDRYKAVIEVLDSGALARWETQLKAIPDEERKERNRRIKEEHEALSQSIDDAINRNIATGKVFTSYDIATQTGSSAQHASTRIRSFVRKGSLEAIPGDYPRKYKVAEAVPA